MPKFPPPSQQLAAQANLNGEDAAMLHAGMTGLGLPATVFQARWAVRNTFAHAPVVLPKKRKSKKISFASLAQGIDKKKKKKKKNFLRYG